MQSSTFISPNAGWKMPGYAALLQKSTELYSESQTDHESRLSHGCKTGKQHPAVPKLDFCVWHRWRNFCLYLVVIRVQFWTALAVKNTGQLERDQRWTVRMKKGLGSTTYAEKKLKKMRLVSPEKRRLKGSDTTSQICERQPKIEYK